MTRTSRLAMMWAFVAGLIATRAAAALPADCDTLRRHGQQAQARTCYQSLTGTADPYLRAEGFWGLERYDDANNQFRIAVAAANANALYRVRWGRLLHERFNNKDAADLFNEALQRDAKNTGAYIGLALLGADGFDDKAQAYIDKALQLDPASVEAHQVNANLALEDADPSKAVEQADLAIGLAPDALDAFAIRAAADLLADRSPDPWINKMIQVNPTYGQGYALIGFHLVLNRRYDEGVSYYRKAIELDPRLWSARSALAINLMRLGQEEEPRRLLLQCWDNGYRDAATANSLKLLDSYKNFTVFKDRTSILKLNQKEAELLHPYFDDLLKRALSTYEKKYQMTLPDPVQVEVYPDHDDFAVRTYGMPGLGALGVTFGEVIAMDSPSGRTPGSFNWASTLWHEMDHVFVLTATHHRVPRWFAEGLAVHEEGEAQARWANRLTPDIVVALHEKRLLPVADLDRGFIRPTYPEQILVSYYQAGRICDFIQSRWGASTLVDMVHAFAQLKPTPEVIQQVLGLAPERFDEQFQTWLYAGVGPIVDNFDRFRTGLKALVELSRKGQDSEALTQGEALRRLYPEYVEEASPYEIISEIQIRRGNKTDALATLSDYLQHGGERPDTLKTLASLQEEAGKLPDAARTLEVINEIYPVNDEELHRHLGDLWMKQQEPARAIREYAAVVAQHPLDRAGALYKLAQAYFAGRQLDKAEQTVLGALEAAPGFRPAQQLLLQIEDAGTPHRH